MSKIKENYKRFCDLGTTDDPQSLNYKPIFFSYDFLLEILSGTSVNELFDFLKEQHSLDPIGIPFGLKIVAYKILILSEPKNEIFHELAMLDLQLYGNQASEFIDWLELMKNEIKE